MNGLNLEIEELKALMGAARAAASDRIPTLAERRESMSKSGDRIKVPPHVEVVPCTYGGRPAELLTPEGTAENSLFLYLHGGGYTSGSIRSHRYFVADMAKQAGMNALIIDYRLAPEDPFPAGLNDALAAWDEALGKGFDPARMIIAGDSAGGGLVMSTLLALRDAGKPLPAAAVLISPWVDLQMTGESMTSKAGEDPIIRAEGLHVAAAQYAADRDLADPAISTIHADLAGLPPLLIQVGTAETLLDDSRRLATKARADGVDVTLEEWPDMIHVWHAYARFLADARKAIDRIGEYARVTLKL